MDRETRRYDITATKEQLDILETLFHTMQRMGAVGSSRRIKLYVDGDGAFHPTFEKIRDVTKVAEDEIVPLNDLITETNETRYNNETLQWIEHGDGIIRKNCEEWKGEGFYIYYDFG